MTGSRSSNDKTSPPPHAPVRPERRTVHGVELIDPYSWMRADNWREVLRDPAALPKEIKKHLDAENDYADRILAPTKTLRDSLKKELRARIKEDDEAPPTPDGPWEYYEKYREGGENEIFCRRSRGGGDEQILLDGDALAKGKDFFEIQAAEQSPDHQLLAWSVDENGSEFCSLRIRDIETGADLDQVDDTEGSIVWSADSKSVYYVRLDNEHRPCKVFRHRLGTSPDADELIFEESDPSYFVHIDETLSGAFGLIDVSDHDSSEVRVFDLVDPSATPRLIAPRRKGVRYHVDHHDDDFLIRTDADGAEDYKIVVAPIAASGPESWRDLIPHRSGVTLVAHVCFKNYLIRLEREDGLPRIVVRRFDDGSEHNIAFDEEAYSLSLRDGFEYDVDILRFSYSSMTTPQEIYDYNLSTQMRSLVKRQEIPSGHNRAQYITRRIFARAADGEKIPISLLHRRDLDLTGETPLLLQGYGAYGHATPASFSANRFSLVDRGFIYALAHVRGGSDRGRRWYADGKLQKKPNTFSDFVSASQFLIDQGFTAPGKIVALGGSAGGMLMGAVANLAPDLFAGVIADVPFVDVLNTMLDDSLPLTPPEWLEWGNPIADPSAFQTIRSYSPYDNVRPCRYPPILALAGLTDPRVTYWEPAKWVAKLRAATTGGGPILLKTNMQAGHGGASGRFQALDEVALEYAFALTCVSEGFAA